MATVLETQHLANRKLFQKGSRGASRTPNVPLLEEEVHAVQKREDDTTQHLSTPYHSRLCHTSSGGRCVNFPGELQRQLPAPPVDVHPAMRILRSLLLLAASSILPIAFAEKPASNSPSKLEKFQKLTADPAVSSAGLIKLNNALYKDITTAPRDYSVMVLLTAMDPHYQCVMCRLFGPEYALLAKSWSKEHPNGDALFFSELDFSNGKETFMKVPIGGFGSSIG